MAKEKWAVLDCSRWPSDKNCRFKMECPEDDLEELIELSAVHAVREHGHKDSKDLREGLKAVVAFEMR